MKHYKKAILNVSDKDSPYALIDKYFPERESYFYQNRNKFLSEFRDSGRGGGGADIGDLDPSEVSVVMLTIHVGPGCGSIRFVIFRTRLRKAKFRAKIVNISQYQNIHNFRSEVHFAQACRGNDVCSHSKGHRE